MGNVIENSESEGPLKVTILLFANKHLPLISKQQNRRVKDVESKAGHSRSRSCTATFKWVLYFLL